jgi:aryl-alcohol dehydrogenase-like predicted oxidoreductase
MPFPWRLTPQTLHSALAASLQRLGVESVALYQIHAPFSLIRLPKLMDALADLVAEGQTRAVGVSNYNAEQTRRAHDALARRGVPLATNQIQYSLLARQPEQNGTLAACRDLGVTVLAYSPLAQGRLTGKYQTAQPPTDLRRFQKGFQPRRLRQLGSLLDLIAGIGQDHGGKTPAQVALNWLMQQANVVPIPGAKTATQAISNAGALGWSLRPAEVNALSRATRD